MWIYENTSNNSARFALGESGNQPLICFGVNASTAKPKKLDRTVSRVQSISKQENFDGWIMLNLYPQRATKPSDIHQEMDANLHKENLKHIKKVFQGNQKSTVWVAWGGLIESRTFLKQCLRDIVEVIEPYSTKCVHKGRLLTHGHPRHPLYLRNDAAFSLFDIKSYLKNIGGIKC